MELNDTEINVDFTDAQNVLTPKEKAALLAYFKKHVPIKENKTEAATIKDKKKNK